MLSRIVQIALMFVALSLLAACGSESIPSPYTGYLTEEISPCTPLDGSFVDPCESEVKLATNISRGMGSSSIPFHDEPLTVRQMLDGPITYIPHIVLRGTYITDTVRCTSGNPNRVPSYATPGYFQNSIIMLCYADVRVNSYIQGSGPTRLTVLVNYLHYWDGWFAKDAANLGMTEEEAVEFLRSSDEFILEEGPRGSGGIGGREVVMFIGPSHSASIEVWEVFETWDVQRREDDTVVAVHPHRDAWRETRPTDYQTHLSALEMELPALAQAVTTAHQARVTEYGGKIASANIEGRAEGVELPMFITDVHSLDEFMRSTGAYNHPDGPPEEPPAP